VSFVVLGRRARLVYRPPALDALLAPPPSPSLARGFFVSPLFARQFRVRVIGTRTNGSRWLSNLVEESSHVRFASRTYCCPSGHSFRRLLAAQWTCWRQGGFGPQHIVDAIWLFLGIDKGISAPP
jgi:hypothetical protein